MIDMGSPIEFHLSKVVRVGYNHISGNTLEEVVHQECDSLVYVC